MGCVNACICSGNCLRCGSYKKEEYIGHAEDLYDYLHGNLEQRPPIDWMIKQRQSAYDKKNKRKGGVE